MRFQHWWFINRGYAKLFINLGGPPFLKLPKKNWGSGGWLIWRGWLILTLHFMEKHNNQHDIPSSTFRKCLWQASIARDLPWKSEPLTREASCCCSCATCAWGLFALSLYIHWFIGLIYLSIYLIYVVDHGPTVESTDLTYMPLSCRIQWGTFKHQICNTIHTHTYIYIYIYIHEELL